MSAFLCSTTHTVALARALHRRGLAGDTVAAAMLLRDANNKALVARYGDAPTPLDPIGEVPPKEYTDPQVNTLARCFLYQCAEGDVLETHPAAKLLETLVEKTGGEHVEHADGFWGI